MEREPGRLLIVQGPGDRREALRQRLEEAGHRTVMAESLAAVGEIVRAQEPDLIFVDCHLPDASGPAVVARIMAEPIGPAIPIVIVARPDDADTVAGCLAAGAEDYLYEPVSTTLLRAQVRELLGIGARRRQDLRRAERENLLKFERDVQVGRDIQRQFLPEELPRPAGWEIVARLHPAREVAGDFYDAFPLAQGRRLALVIADVCDKGVGAAIYMGLFRSLLRAYAEQNTSRWMSSLGDMLRPSTSDRPRFVPQTGTIAAKTAMEQTNEYMVRTHAGTGMFATVFFGVLDPTTGQLAYANGGHNAPLVLRRSGETVRLTRTGPAVGILPEARFEIEQVRLEPGDLFFAFTDGVPDARDPAGQRFGEPRMLELLAGPVDSALAPLDRLDDALRAFIGSAYQYDDITLLAAWRRPAEVG